MGARITRPGRLLGAIEGLSVDFPRIGLEVDFERSPLARLRRDLAEPAELVFGVMPVVSEDDAALVDLNLLLKKAIVHPEVVGRAAPVVVLITARVGALRRSRHVETAIFSVEETTARDHRENAQRFADTSEWALAVREWLRAIARELEQRGVLDPRPGRTAVELSREAGARLPALTDDLRMATAAFDAIWYGGRPATAADEQLLRDLDATVAGSHRSLAAAR